MAEFVFKDMVKKRGLSDLFVISSAATSSEETGNPVHPGTRKKLKQYNISVDGKRAVRLTEKDYQKYDYIIGMEQANIRNMIRIMGEDSDKKVFKLLDFSDNPRDIADPWYTGDFDRTYADVYEGCEGLLEYVLREK